MIRTLVLAAIATCLALVTTSHAEAAPDCTQNCAGAGDSYFWSSVHGTGGKPSRHGEGSAAQHVSGRWQSQAACALGGLAACHASALCPNGLAIQERYLVQPDGTKTDVSRWCPSRSRPSTSQVDAAFKRLPLPASPLHIQPGGGRTRVNFDTLFYTTAKPFTRTVTLLGRQITFHITPTAYAWAWGDGHTDHTTWPGRPYDPHIPLTDDITHRYESAATFQARLDTTYTATYTVDGSHPRAVPGTVTIVGTPVSLRADTYTPVLVD